MRISPKTFAVVISLALTGFYCSTSLAKGLDDLQPADPPPAAEGADKAKPTEDGKKAVSAEKKIEPSATSKALADKLYLATGYSWVSAAKSKGEWTSAGMSDVTVGYQLPMTIKENVQLFGTFRYAPIAVSGTVDKHNYRGVWEAYNFGATGFMSLGDNLVTSGSVELAYVKAGLRSLDNLEGESSDAAGGVMFSLGGGADWLFGPKIAIGPRLRAGFGSYSAYQLGASARFLF